MNTEFKIIAQIMAIRVWCAFQPSDFEDFSDEVALKLLFEYEELDNFNPYLHHAKAMYIHRVHREELNHAIQFYFLAAPNYPVGSLLKANAWATLGWVCELGHPTEKDFPHLYKFAKQAIEEYNSQYNQSVKYSEYVDQMKKKRLGKKVTRRINKCFKCGKRDGHLKACSACKWAVYCSADCQKMDWVDHKAQCNKIKAKELEVHTESIEGSIIYYLAEEWKQ